MDVVGHEAISQDLQAVLDGVFDQQLQVSLTIGIFAKNIFSPIAPLSDVVRNSWKDYACDSRHVAMLMASPRLAIAK